MERNLPPPMPDILRREGERWEVRGWGGVSEAWADPALGSSRLAQSLMRA